VSWWAWLIVGFATGAVGVALIITIWFVHTVRLWL
jgi:hypothetical protein